MHWGPGMGWGVMICGGAIGLLFLIALVVLVIWLITRTSTGKPSTERPSQTPLEILKERYARGEITEEEYLEMRDRLRE
ncbi:MAG: SHOCT domain-containing protein [Armatimonadota bacterium]|jgi:putative membrane protein|nr:SHOCT domain-containing protein [Armatimonadota bacterium]